MLLKNGGLFEYFNCGRELCVPATPLTGLPSPDEDYIHANDLIHWEVKRRGLRILTTEEKEGREIHDIIPIKGKEGDYSNEGSKNFPFHVEVPHYSLDERPDYVMLFCLRGHPMAHTFVIPVVKLLSMLDDKYLDILCKPLFTANFGKSFSTDEKFLTAIVEEGGCTIDFAEMSGTSPESEEALNLLKTLSERYFSSLAYTFALKEGDVLIFDNKKCIHARGDFSKYMEFNGDHRWLKRVYLKKTHGNKV